MKASSPLTRGKHRQDRGRPRCPRLIPTHAGKTSSFSWLLRRSADHPRSRGENEFDTETNAHAWGSSPLTRGKTTRVQLRVNGRGLIPAHAGKTPARHAQTLSAGAHPRSQRKTMINRRQQESVVHVFLDRNPPFRLISA